MAILPAGEDAINSISAVIPKRPHPSSRPIHPANIPWLDLTVSKVKPLESIKVTVKIRKFATVQLGNF
jgi:hypothetical protein